MYVLVQAHTHQDPVFTLRGQWLFFSTGSKVSNKKSNTVNALGHQHINI